jgi:hemoglobin-like flavoprotein
MSAAQLETLKNRLETVIALARLLERVEHSRVPIGPDQYRALVRQLAVALSQEMPDDALQAVLGAHPAAAEVYENMHYAQSGLSRSSLERSVESEKLARQALNRAAQRA